MMVTQEGRDPMGATALMARGWSLLGVRDRAGGSAPPRARTPTVEEAAALSPEWGRVEARRLSSGGGAEVRWETGARRSTF